uniref:Cytosol aminopeptidase n=1 Tax=Romanomermis culicivorax TaxID=13658 RepID=A0A915IMW9_ROMCU
MRFSLNLLVKGRKSLAQHEFSIVRYLSKMERRGLVLGIYTENGNNSSASNLQNNVEKKEPSPHTVDQFSSWGKKFNDETSGVILKQLNCSEPLKCGKNRILYGLTDKYSAVAVAGLGKRGAGIDLQEQIHYGRENVRSAIAGATKALKDIGCKAIDVDPCGYPTAAAEGAIMSIFNYDELKSKKQPKPQVIVNLLTNGEDSKEAAQFEDGIILAEGQNLCRKLTDMPANLLTPTKFAEIAQQLAEKEPSLQVIARDKAWAEKEKMFSFLSVSQGSAEPPVFLEMRLKSKNASPDRPPVVLVGKGVCFDSGGISLKPSANMDKMRGDMGGAANVLAALYTLSRLNVNLPFDVVGLTPLVENMPGGRATKPGDVFFARNGKSIKVDNTDAEGRLILADALCYADTFKPSHVIDLATLTGAMVMALGATATGVFCSDDKLWQKILDSSIEVGDRVWRMPLFKAYNAKMKADCADLNNIAKPGSGAGSCVAAGFLREFVECNSWAHFDIAGTMEADGDIAYISKGMTGRPLRLLVHLLESLE